MALSKKQSIAIQFLILLILVIVFSVFSTTVWGGKPEKIPENSVIKIHASMTLMEFSLKNEIPKLVVKEIFGLKSSEELQKTISSFSFSNDEITKNANIQLALFAEDSSKNWDKIVIKFIA